MPNRIDRARVARMMVAAAAVFGLLLARLAYLQVVRGPELAVAAFRQRASLLPLELPRGDIFDREGRALNAPVVRWRVIVHRPAVTDVAGLASRLAGLLGLDARRVRERLGQQDGPFVTVASSAPPALAQRLADEQLPGVVVVPYRERYGPAALAPHVVGYVNRSDNRGVAGLEKAYDRWLRGRVPASLVALHDARRRSLGGLRLLPARPQDAGADVITTLDADLQARVEKALEGAGRPGAAVVVDIGSGDILAMASVPAFDPGAVEGYLKAGDAPLVNRAVSAYPPGSVFKLVVAAAALERDTLDPGARFPCTGEIAVGRRRIESRCPAGATSVTWQEALAHSSNEVFVRIGLGLGGREITRWARALGFGSATGTGLPEEAAGHIPAPGDLAADGDVANVALGQGPLLVTPVQVARLIAAVAADGELPGLRLVREIRRTDGLLLQAYPRPERVRVFSPRTAGLLRRALRLAVVEGTGRRAEVPEWGAAGKTGTAETGPARGGGERRAHAWFAGYVPAYLPRYAIVVLIEGGGSGPDTAAPVFREIAEAALQMR